VAREAQLALIAPEKQPEALCDVADLEASLRLSAAGAQSVLELGCGLHPIGHFLAVQLGVPRVVCADASRQAVLAMRGKFGSVGGLRLFKVDAERLVRNLEAASVCGRNGTSAPLREPCFDRAAWSVAPAPAPERRCTVLTFFFQSSRGAPTSVMAALHDVLCHGPCLVSEHHLV
jgi:hypothetical protein